MRLGKDLLDKPIISVTDGRMVGKVKDLYLDEKLETITAFYLGSEGIFSRRSMLVNRDHITLLGLDAMLADNSDVVVEEAQSAEVSQWIRRQDLIGREVDTSGGTKVGAIGDVIVNDEGQVIGFKLARIFVEGPIARKQVVAREVVVDVGHVDGAMTIDMAQAEQHSLSLS
jgi:sporulation protein YlmC with PRC-barrel domain